MMYFSRAYLPDTCYIEEVALWLSVGILPEIRMWDDEGDGRRFGEAAEGGETIGYHYSFEYLVFATYGIEVDWDQYLASVDCRNGIPGTTFDEYIENMQLPDMALKELSPYYKKMFEAASYANEVEKPLRPYIEDARIEVYKALRDGRLEAEGWVEFTEDELEKKGNPSRGRDGDVTYEAIGEFRRIPSSEWAFANFEWFKNWLKTPDRMYKAVQVKSEDMMELFPKPNIPQFSGGDAPLYGETVVMELGYKDDEHSGSVHTGPKKRGAPTKQSTLSVKDAVINHLKYLRRSGGLPEKREAIISEAQEWAERIFPDVNVSRGTAQNYVKAMEEEDKLSAPKSTVIMLSAK